MSGISARPRWQLSNKYYTDCRNAWKGDDVISWHFYGMAQYLSRFHFRGQCGSLPAGTSGAAPTLRHRGAI